MSSTKKLEIDPCWEKIRRADEVITEIERSAAEISTAPDSYEVRKGFIRSDVEFSILVKPLRKVPTRLAVVAGDAVHSMRSALDWLVAALVERNGFDVDQRHQFPICSTPEAFESELKKKRLRGISADAVKIIRDCQPFHEKNPADHFLMVMHELNNQDKHRLPLALAATARLNAQQMVDIDAPGGATIDNLDIPLHVDVTAAEAAICTVRVQKPTPSHFDVRVGVVLDVCFKQCGSVELPGVVHVLRILHNATAELLRTFERSID